ncbi:MAG: glycosyltransferase [Anaerolineales bacterium]|nr:glycosyltransferase [Anaerolineales bacterium]
MRIALLHYSGPPTVGGVEQTLYHHARILADLGYKPQLIVGTGQSFNARIPVTLIPTLYSKHPDVLTVKSELDSGHISDRFNNLRDELSAHLNPILDEIEILIVHNALTLHKNLALSAALWRLRQERDQPFLIGWHHDFAWAREQYRDELHDGPPWDLLKQAWPGVANVVVSASQQKKIARLYGTTLESIHVIPPGIDPAISGNWTETTRWLAKELKLLQSDGILLLPARITPRKNIELAIQVLAEIRTQTGEDIRLLITGPPGPHNPANIAYLQNLLSLQAELGLKESVHFLYQLDPTKPLQVDDQTMANLYALSDALFFPSREEGFGIPLLEAGFARLPIFCTDIPPFHESAGAQAHYFSLEDSPLQVAALIGNNLFQKPHFLLQRKVRRWYTWEGIITRKILPLLESTDDESDPS